ncbi:MAG TPA: TetR/AcrR family transcriptional regulator [Marmoricola sp.]|nr:TetR/AcrR family transcriptional regulator [Marmoricola sp.]
MSAGDRRELLVEAAIRVMTREGVAKATTRAIAAEAEMPLGVFHYAFRSKQELMTMVTETIARQSKAEIDAAVLGEEPPELLDLVLAGLYAYFDHVVQHPHEHLVTYELTTNALRDEELLEVGKRQYDYYLEENAALLEAVAELMGFEYTEPLPVINRYVFSVMDGLALNWLARGDEDEARAVLDLLARTLTTLVRPTGGADE